MSHADAPDYLIRCMHPHVEHSVVPKQAVWVIRRLAGMDRFDLTTCPKTRGVFLELGSVLVRTTVAAGGLALRADVRNLGYGIRKLAVSGGPDVLKLALTCSTAWELLGASHGG